MRNQSEVYKDYIVSVLGVTHILNEKSSEILMPTKVLIYVENYNTYTLAESELLNKIISAIKLKTEDFKILSFSSESEITDGNAHQILIFKDHTKTEINENTMVTFSPRMLLVQPTLKKEVWDGLQKFKQV